MKFEYPLYSHISLRNPKHLSAFKSIERMSFDYDVQRKNGSGEFRLIEFLYQTNVDPRSFWDYSQGEQIIWMESTDKSTRVMQLGISNLKKIDRFTFSFDIWNYGSK